MVACHSGKEFTNNCKSGGISRNILFEELLLKYWLATATSNKSFPVAAACPEAPISKVTIIDRCSNLVASEDEPNRIRTNQVGRGLSSVDTGGCRSLSVGNLLIVNAVLEKCHLKI